MRASGATWLPALEQNLADVRMAVQDWRALQDAMAADIATLPNGDGPEGEGAALLAWLLDRNFTLLGHEGWRGGTRRRRSASRAIAHPVPLLAEASRALAMRWFSDGGTAPLLLKSNLISSVHRHVPLDLAVVPVRDTEQGYVGLSIHAGLWTSSRAQRRTASKCPCCARGWPRWKRSSVSIRPRAIPARR